MDFHSKSAPLIVLKPATAGHFGCNRKSDDENPMNPPLPLAGEGWGEGGSEYTPHLYRFPQRERRSEGVQF